MLFCWAHLLHIIYMDRHTHNTLHTYVVVCYSAGHISCILYIWIGTHIIAKAIWRTPPPNWTETWNLSPHWGILLWLDHWERRGGGELENHLNRSEWYRAPRISGSTAEWGPLRSVNLHQSEGPWDQWIYSRVMALEISESTPEWGSLTLLDL